MSETASPTNLSTGCSAGRPADRREEAVAGVMARRARVPQRGPAPAQGAAPEPGVPAWLLRFLRSEDARLPLLPQWQPRPHSLQ